MEEKTELHARYSQISLLQYVATITGTLASVTSGMYFGWSTPSLPQLLSNDSPIPITSSEGSWIAVMPCIGAPPGAILGALIVDRIGRKSSMLIVSPFYFISWLAIAFFPNLHVLYISRFIAGVMDGVTFTVLPMYLGEISDRRIRGLLGSSLAVTYSFGFMAINAIGLYCSMKATALIASIVPLMHFITFIWMPESPYYYMAKHNTHQAAVSLKKLTGATNINDELNNICADNTLKTAGIARFLNLFKEKSNRKALTILLGLRVNQQFSGIYPIAFYCLIIFNEAGGFISGRTSTLIYFSVQVCVTIVSSVLVDKTGRRPLLIISIIGAGFALTLEGLYFYLKEEMKAQVSILNYLPLTALLLFNIMYNIGLGTVPMLMTGELFSTDVKAFALCIVDISYGLLILAASKFFQIVNDKFGLYVPFLTFTVCCAASLIFIIFCVPETKGKTLQEIQKELKGEPSKTNVTHSSEEKRTGDASITSGLPQKT